MKRRPTAARGLHARGLYPSGMAAALLLACMVLLGSAGLCAQDTSKIPTLKVWYEVPGVYDASYVENFDTDRGGKNALVLYRPRGESSTLYMRDRGDTVNMFTWGKWKTYDAGLWAGQVDFNGDGISDYLLDDGVVYQGRVKNGPPDSLPVAKYALNYWGIASRRVDDFNGDGKQDFITGTVSTSVQSSAPSGPIGKIILGNSDLTKMEVVDMPQLEGAYSIQNIVSAWRENGKSYVVLYQYTDSGYNPRSDKFVLYEFVITDTGVVYTQRDRITTMQWPTSSTPYYSFSSSFVWHSRDGKEHTLVVSVLKDASTQVFRIVNGRFVYRWTKTRREGSSKLLTHGIRSLATNGYTRGNNPVIYIYEGNPAADSMAVAKIPIGLSGYGPYGDVISCGDVNNDGLGDIAVTYIGNNTGMLRICLGADSISAVEETDPMAPTMTLRNAQVGIDGSLGIELHIVRAARYTLELYDLRGNRVQALLDESFPSGNHDRVLQLSGANLPSGLYNLRLSDGVRAVDKGILIPR